MASMEFCQEAAVLVLPTTGILTNIKSFTMNCMFLLRCVTSVSVKC